MQRVSKQHLSYYQSVRQTRNKLPDHCSTWPTCSGCVSRTTGLIKNKSNLQSGYVVLAARLRVRGGLAGIAGAVLRLKIAMT